MLQTFSDHLDTMSRRMGFIPLPLTVLLTVTSLVVVVVVVVVVVLLLLLLFQAFSDHLDTMSRRMGFVPLPLAVLLIRVVTQSLRLTSPLSYIIVLVLYLWSVVMSLVNNFINV